MFEVLSEIVHNPWPFLIQTLLAEFIVVVTGVIVAQVILNNWLRWRHGGWHVVVKEGDTTHVDRSISPAKAKEIRSEPADLSVFLKGVVSPYARLHCDLIEKGEGIGLLVIENKAKRFVINLDCNPDKEGNAYRDTSDEVVVL